MDITTPNIVAPLLHIVGSCCMRVGSGVQTNATTPNNVASICTGLEGTIKFIE